MDIVETENRPRKTCSNALCVIGQQISQGQGGEYNERYKTYISQKLVLANLQITRFHIRANFLHAWFYLH